MNLSSAVLARWVWVFMMIGIGIEFALGVACAVQIPVGRHAQWVPPQSEGVYIAHVVVGGLLAIGALIIFVSALGGSRFVRLGVQLGLVGLLFGAAGAC